MKTILPVTVTGTGITSKHETMHEFAEFRRALMPKELSTGSLACMSGIDIDEWCGQLPLSFLARSTCKVMRWSCNLINFFFTPVNNYESAPASISIAQPVIIFSSKFSYNCIYFVRAEYNPDQYLWEKEFTLASRTYQRQDLEASMDIIYLMLKNARGYTLKCSHYLPSPFPEDTSLPCVIYCHGNSGCRADANEAAVILLPSNITVFTLDFSGSGLSDGEYVSLGWHEKDDLKMVVSYLRSNKQISRIGLWGRSMGAVTSLLYGAEDPSIAGMVLDSAFSNLYNLMMELVDVYKIRLPKFTVKMAVQYMRRVIEKKAKFDIMNLNCLLVAPKTFIPVLFGHASDDKFIQPHHSDLISESYAGDKNVIKFDGDHNSSRPQLFYDSVSIFFYNVLRPPNVPRAHSKLEKYYDLGNLKLGSGVEENQSNLILISEKGDCEIRGGGVVEDILNICIVRKWVISKELLHPPQFLEKTADASKFEIIEPKFPDEGYQEYLRLKLNNLTAFLRLSTCSSQSMDCQSPWIVDSEISTSLVD
ncbi:hypothetical protein V8G54_015344 [Vigna mungo]|uniref:Serine aminopeptidase S33 domain-containing protein n=1 Tax=Vigna mungo TaxID=3915 RepID=A0AAQ3NID3_VIGMU